MDKEGEYTLEYQQARQKLEEEDDLLREFQWKGQALAEETFSGIQQMIERFSDTSEPLDLVRYEIEQIREEFQANIAQERRKLVWQEEEAEQSYREKMQSLREH